MDDAEFSTLAAAFGADLSRWPAAARRPAADLLRDSAACRTALAEAGELDAALWAARPTIAPERLRRLAENIVAAREEQIAAAGRWPMSGRNTGIFLAGMLAIGLSIGLLAAPWPIAPAGLFEIVPGDGLFGGLL